MNRTQTGAARNDGEQAPIRVQGLTKDYGGGRGVFDVSFQVQAGEVFGFLGSNGAGKTVTMRHLMGFIRPQAGSARIFGLDCFRDRAAIQARLGYLPAEMAIYEDMTAGEYLKLVQDMRAGGDPDRTRELVERFELDPGMKIRKMSKGNKQKAGLVCAFMGRPDVLLLDEPTSGLDPLMQARFIELVLEERDRGATVFLSSHIFEEVERVCDRVAFIRNGRLADIRDMDQVRGQRRHAFQVRFADGAQRGAFEREAASGMEARRVGDDELEIVFDGDVDPVLKALARHTVTGLATREQSLEEMFMAYYGEGAAR